MTCAGITESFIKDRKNDEHFGVVAEKQKHILKQ